MSTTIYLIRHGETTGDVENRYGGDYDDHLTDKGFQQAAALTQQLAGNGIEFVLHSPRIRACEVANVVVGTLGLPSEEVDDLRERNNYGILTGLNKEAAHLQYPEECDKLVKDHIHHDVTNAEPYDQFKDRVCRAFCAAGDRPEKTIALITHGGVIGCVGRELLNEAELAVGDCGYVEMHHPTPDTYRIEKIVHSAG